MNLWCVYIYILYIYVFPKIVLPQNGWFTMENPMNKLIIWGVIYPYFWKHLYIYILIPTQLSIFTRTLQNSSRPESTLPFLPWILASSGVLPMDAASDSGTRAPPKGTASKGRKSPWEMAGPPFPGVEKLARKKVVISQNSGISNCFRDGFTNGIKSHVPNKGKSTV